MIYLAIFLCLINFPFWIWCSMNGYKLERQQTTNPELEFGNNAWIRAYKSYFIFMRHYAPYTHMTRLFVGKDPLKPKSTNGHFRLLKLPFLSLFLLFFISFGCISFYWRGAGMLQPEIDKKMHRSWDQQSKSFTPTTIHGFAQSAYLLAFQKMLSDNPSLLNERNPVVWFSYLFSSFFHFNVIFLGP